MTTYSYNKDNKQRAIGLRHLQTDAENLLWNKLRSCQILNLKFRRQHPITYYILDFYCAEIKLCIELDGNYHNNPERCNHDKNRTIHLESLGIKVVRFWDNDVIKDIDRVLKEIEKIAGELLKTNYK